MLTANKTSRKTKRSVCFVEKACLQSQKVLTKGPVCFVNPGAFCELPGFLQKVDWSTGVLEYWSTCTSGLQLRFEVVWMLLCFRFEFRSPHPMTTALASIASHPSTETIGNPHMTMTSNDVLNAFCRVFLMKMAL